MIEILKRLDAGEECITHELAYGRDLMKNWPDIVGHHYDAMVNEMIENGLPGQMHKEYVNDAEEAGIDHQSDEVRFTYLYTTALSFDHVARALVLYRHCFLHKIEPVVFQDERPYYILMGHLGLQIVFRGRNVSMAKLSQIVNLLKEIIE